MNKRLIGGRRVLAILVGVTCAASAAAHHGFVSYLEEEYMLTGTVTDMYFGFPHPQLTVESDGETWNLWLAAFGRVSYVCFNEDLKVGDEIIAVGHRVPDQSRLEMKAKNVLLGSEFYDFYPPDNPLGGNANPQRSEPCPT
ncbi:MAG: hypothetical protein ACJ0SL_07960 [Candidatus Rariloculaceae bacterium]